MRSRGLLLLGVVALLSTICRAGQPGAFLTEKNVAIPMRDGVVLRANILRPASGTKFPTLVYRTPYGKDATQQHATTFRRAVEHGYAVVVEDVRGRYASDGEFRPYQNEAHDGYDTIEWAARQPWSDGNIGTFGLSYPGAVQWLAAVENPPHLKAMVPAMTFSTPQNFFYAWGEWDLSWIQWIYQNIAPDIRLKKHLPGPTTLKEANEQWTQTSDKMLSTVPLNQLEELKDVAPYYYDWLSHPMDDPWWNWAELRSKYDRVHAAVLNFSAWYDDNYGPEGATTNFAGLLKARAGEKNPRTRLIFGPWVHGGQEEAKAGEREFSKDAAIDYDGLILAWMDHYLRGIDNGVEKEPAVRYFVMGKNEWRDSASWPPAAKATRFYFSAANNSGGLVPEKPQSADQSFSFISDPANPVRNIYANSGAHDYRALASRADVLTFDSPALDSDVEVTGPIEADVFLSCECRDVDLWVRLLDVAPDGTAFNLMTPGLDVQRLSYRDVSKGRQLLNPGEKYEVKLNHLITSNVFLKGHKIRVQISGSFFPNFSRNPQNGDLEATSSVLQKAKITIYADKEHASHIVLPVR
jgi:uncharacterized protein